MAINLTQAQLSAALDVAANKYAGQKVAYQGQYVGECLSLCKQVYTDITGLTMPGAVNNYYWSDSYWLYFDQSPPLPSLFIRTPYVPGTNYPKGSLVFYAATHHIGVWWGDNKNGTHTVFEQNADPDGSPAHFSARANSKITGILVPLTTDIGGKGAATQGETMPYISDAELQDFKVWKDKGMYYENKLVPAMQADKQAWVNNFAIVKSQLEALQNKPPDVVVKEIPKIINQCDVNLDSLPADKASWLVQFVAWLTRSKP